MVSFLLLATEKKTPFLVQLEKFSVLIFVMALVSMYPRLPMKITVLCQERPGSSSAKVASRTYFF